MNASDLPKGTFFFFISAHKINLDAKAKTEEYKTEKDREI